MSSAAVFTITEVLEAVGGELLQDSKIRRLKGVSTDTRSLLKGELFVAIKGDRFDGHDYLELAISRGAGALLVSRPVGSLPAGVAVIRVDDTVKAYGLLARYHRRRFKIPLLAVTGSAGKTTTKELLAAVLGTRLKVLYNPGTENNHMGVPATLLRLSPRYEVAVIEAGTNHPGEIDWLGTIIEPTAAVFTNVGPSHLSGLGSPEGVFREKASLIDHTAPKGAVVLNADDPWLARLLNRKLEQQVITYGLADNADVRAGKVELGARKLSFEQDGVGFELRSPVWANVHNALATLACAKWLGLSPEEMRRGLLKFRPPRGRQVMHRIGRVVLIDDTYNANPLSYKNAVMTLKALKGNGRAILVGADMLELGEGSENLHREVGAFAADNGVDVLVACGQMARFMAQEAQKAHPLMPAFCLDTQAEAVRRLKEMIRPGDIVLVKGSRGMRMEGVVQELIEHLKG